MTVLDVMILAARSLNDQVTSDYARGQAELIVDVCGLSMDLHRNLVLAAITHTISFRDFHAKLTP